MKCFPKQVNDRYTLLCELRSVKDSLAAVNEREDTAPDPEARSRMEARIEELEREISKSNKETLDFIERFESNLTVYIAVSLHYIHGLDWDSIAAQLDRTKASIIVATKRLYEKQQKGGKV